MIFNNLQLPPRRPRLSRFPRDDAWEAAAVRRFPHRPSFAPPGATPDEVEAAADAVALADAEAAQLMERLTPYIHRVLKLSGCPGVLVPRARAAVVSNVLERRIPPAAKPQRQLSRKARDGRTVTKQREWQPLRLEHGIASLKALIKRIVPKAILDVYFGEGYGPSPEATLFHGDGKKPGVEHFAAAPREKIPGQHLDFAQRMLFTAADVVRIALDGEIGPDKDDPAATLLDLQERAVLRALRELDLLRPNRAQPGVWRVKVSDLAIHANLTIDVAGKLALKVLTKIAAHCRARGIHGSLPDLSDLELGFTFGPESGIRSTARYGEEREYDNLGTNRAANELSRAADRAARADLVGLEEFTYMRSPQGEAADRRARRIEREAAEPATFVPAVLSDALDDGQFDHGGD